MSPTLYDLSTWYCLRITTTEHSLLFFVACALYYILLKSDMNTSLRFIPSYITNSVTVTKHCQNYHHHHQQQQQQQPIPVAARSKTRVYGRSLSGIMGSSPTGGMDVSCECSVLSGRGLCDGLITRPEESYWQRSWSLDIEEARAH
jgi:hypothetical protein